MEFTIITELSVSVLKYAPGVGFFLSGLWGGNKRVAAPDNGVKAVKRLLEKESIPYFEKIEVANDKGERQVVDLVIPDGVGLIGIQVDGSIGRVSQEGELNDDNPHWVHSAHVGTCAHRIEVPSQKHRIVSEGIQKTLRLPEKFVSAVTVFTENPDFRFMQEHAPDGVLNLEDFRVFLSRKKNELNTKHILPDLLQDLKSKVNSAKGYGRKTRSKLLGDIRKKNLAMGTAFLGVAYYWNDIFNEILRLL